MMAKRTRNGNFSEFRSFDGGHNSTRAIALGDLNRNGIIDIVIGNINHGNQILLSSDEHVPYSLPDDDKSLRAVSLGDLDGEGIIDIVIGNLEYLNEVLYGLDTGTFESGRNLPGIQLSLSR